MNPIRSLIHEVDQNPEFRDRLTRDPSAALRDFSQGRVRSPLDTDVFVYRMVAGALGLIGILSVLACVALAYAKPASSEVLTGVIALGSVAVGAMAGLLAPRPRQ